ncbi:zgc:172076 [Xyrichtys novacula]|uniref:creatine kinase n=1 Tax=Xyrichtys novacula TaxID=13765 RepID=A0AAV1EZ20_XYRNO|nr:zgc:172076 [Xyrichtys novacula]
MWKVKPPIVFPKETRYRPILEGLVPPDPMSQFHLKRRSPEDEFPDLCRNSTWMGRILTPAMYCRQFDRCTHSGVIFDDVIRPGLEEPGDWSATLSVGCAAGDAQSYILFCDFFDRVIEAFHKHKVTSQTPESDLNYDNLKGGDNLDRSYAISCEVSVIRAVEDFCFPTHCSRGERRQLLSLARRALQRLQEELPGRLLSVEDLNQEQRTELKLDSPSAFQLRTGVARDWPDARAVWVSEDGGLVVWINIEDHLRLVCTRQDANITETFKNIYSHLQKVRRRNAAAGIKNRFSSVKSASSDLLKLQDVYRDLRHPFIWKQQLGWVTSSPADVGTGLRVKVKVKLQHLPGHRRLQDVLKRLRISMEKTESPVLYCVSNMATFGVSEVMLTQLVVDGVKLLITMETRLEGGGDIDDLVPAQK